MREQTTELVILDVNDFKNSTDEGESISPVARIVLPFRLRSGIHGSWVPASDLGEWKQLCDMDGVDEKTMQTFGEVIYHGTVNGEVLKGHERLDGDHHGGGMDMLRRQRSWNPIRGNGLRICRWGLVCICKDGLGLRQME